MKVFKEIFTRHHSEESLQAKQAYFYPFVGIILLCGAFFVGYYLIWQNYLPAGVILGGSFCILSAIALRYFFPKKIDGVTSTQIFLGSLLATLAALCFFSGCIYSPTILWFPTVPVMAAFLIHGRAALFWTGITLSSIFALYLCSYFEVIDYNYIGKESSALLYLFKGMMGSILLGAVAIVGEYVREKMSLKGRELEKQASRSSNLAALGEMAGGIAHEINNPLMIINGSVMVINKMVKKGEIDQEKLGKHLQTIERTVKRAATIVKGLKTLARDGSSDLMAPFELGEMLEEVLSFLAGRMRHNSVDLIYNEEDEKLKSIVLGQKVQISQVFLNLIGNAFDAISNQEKKWIKIELEERSEVLAIRIIDSGSGIPMDIQEKIFNPFFTTKEVGKGTGLGLSLSFTIMKKNHGKLWIDNDHPHTCFVIEIPLAHGEIIDVGPESDNKEDQVA
jgi:signal transduction histidine kinase